MALGLVVCREIKLIGAIVIDLPPFDALALSLHHSPGVHAILVGSGLSRAAGISTGWEITLSLVRRLAALVGETEHDDWSAWYVSKYGKAPSYSEILDALASTQSERRSILESFIASGEGDESRKPTRAHHAIAKLVSSGAVRVVITTNFDRLIENALRDAGVEPTVIASDDAITGATPLVHSKCTVIKVHGDYLDARIKNTDAELSDYSLSMNTLLDQVFDNFGLLVVGWSGEWDTALRSAILRAPSRRYPFFWAARGAIGPLASELLVQRGGRSFEISDADSFFVKLEETVEALREASRPHPQSIEMAIALARRYCRDDKFALEWAEFLEAEASVPRSYIAGPEYPNPYSSVSNEELNNVVERIVKSMEVLRQSVLICSRWGTEKAALSVISCIKSLVLSEINRSGLVGLLDLRNLAASILFYWFAAGAVAGNRPALLKKLFDLKIERDGKSMKAVEVLPLSAYRDFPWTVLKGLERHHTPASDYLFTIFSNDSRHLAMDLRLCDEVFDTVEALISIYYSNVSRQERNDSLHFWMPIGRYIWKRDKNILHKILNSIEADSSGDIYFNSGLFSGSAADMAETISAIRSFSEAIALKHW